MRGRPRSVKGPQSAAHRKTNARLRAVTQSAGRSRDNHVGITVYGAAVENLPPASLFLTPACRAVGRLARVMLRGKGGGWVAFCEGSGDRGGIRVWSAMPRRLISHIFIVSCIRFVLVI